MRDSDIAVYSFGVGEDISFDLSLINKYNLHIFAFDPTPKSVDWVKNQRLPEQFHFFEYGISDKDGLVNFYPPENSGHVSHSTLKRKNPVHSPIEVKVHRLETIMNTLGHSKIEILKMDIEGAEYAVIEDILKLKHAQIKQLLVEFHHNFPNMSFHNTTKTIALLNKENYKIFHISKSEKEYGFIKYE